jgi:hypothetical protein
VAAVSFSGHTTYYDKMPPFFTVIIEKPAFLDFLAIPDSNLL